MSLVKPAACFVIICIIYHSCSNLAAIKTWHLIYVLNHAYYSKLQIAAEWIHSWNQSSQSHQQLRRINFCRIYLWSCMFILTQTNFEHTYSRISSLFVFEASYSLTGVEYLPEELQLTSIASHCEYTNQIAIWGNEELQWFFIFFQTTLGYLANTRSVMHQ